MRGTHGRWRLLAGVVMAMVARTGGNGFMSMSQRSLRIHGGNLVVETWRRCRSVHSEMLPGDSCVVRYPLLLRIFGGSTEDSSMPTPDESLDAPSSSSGAPQSAPLTSASSEAESTGLGIHSHNFTRLHEIGLPVFDNPDFKDVAQEAKILKQASMAVEEVKGFRKGEKAKERRRLAESKAIHEEGKRNDWWVHGDLEEIKGKPCETCGKILEDEELERKGIEDPFERVKDRAMRRYMDDVLPSSSTPSADIEFWNKVRARGGGDVERRGARGRRACRIESSEELGEERNEGRQDS
eukprot:763635-Hanusia_phi.AAC.3